MEFELTSILDVNGRGLETRLLGDLYLVLRLRRVRNTTGSGDEGSKSSEIFNPFLLIAF